MFRKVLASTGIVALAASTALADFSFQTTTTPTGEWVDRARKATGVFGKRIGDPVSARVAVKGDRMVRRSRSEVSVIDLASETITSIDLQKRTYSVKTFGELKQAMMQKQPSTQPKVSVERTGRTKQVAGSEAKQVILKFEVAAQNGQKAPSTITSEIWIVPSVPGYDEFREFNKRMTEKMSSGEGAGILTAGPGAALGIPEGYMNGSRLDGVPVLQYISLGTQDDSGATPSGNPSSAWAFITELSGFSSSGVDNSEFAVPTGFKEAKADPRRGKR